MSDVATAGYAMKRHVNRSCDDAESRVRQELAEEGFGVLTEINVESVFANKLGADFRPYRILGACNPTFAHQALEAELDIGLLLPCNVVVYEGDSPSVSIIAAIDPVAQLGLAGRSDLLPVATEIRERLERVLAAV